MTGMHSSASGKKTNTSVGAIHFQPPARFSGCVESMALVIAKKDAKKQNENSV